MTIDELLEIEEIRRLRLAYSNYFDGHDVEGLTTLFCEDAVCEFPAEFGGDWVGRDTIVANFAREMGRLGEPYDTMHVVTNPWITITGAEEAHGRCYLIDLLTRQQAGSGHSTTRGGHANPLYFLGMYEDEYRKEEGVWRFARIKLPFFWPDRTFEKVSRPDTHLA